MSMGRRRRERQGVMFVAATHLPQSEGHPFYQAVNRVLDQTGFDDHVESLCAPFYCDDAQAGRPSIPPGVYFRMLRVGYFEGIDSERGIAWRVADSLSLRAFVGAELAESTPDHSSLSRIRRRLDPSVYEKVFQFVLAALGQAGLVKGKTLGIDATTLEANAALRSIVRRDTGEGYQDYLRCLAEAAGIENPAREDLARLDKKRKNKGNNDDWQNPYDPDAKITKMKDGRTHLAHKAEHAVDMESGAVVGVTLQPADEGDTTTWRQTAQAARANLHEARRDAVAAEHIQGSVVEEVVADKGYHSNQVMLDLDEMEIRGYVSEPDRGRRNWQDKHEARDAVYANRRRIKGERGKRLLRRRGELVERSFAHAYETGNMRRTHLRGHENILKRLLIHVAGFNLGLLMRRVLGMGTPRSLQSAAAALRRLLGPLWRSVEAFDRSPELSLASG
ncbi:MAG TPA: transposase [Steroidobacteraceae bacterium]